MPFQPGARLGSYEIIAMIGKGGMGEVYQARDSKLGREVAIKLLPPEFARNHERIARLEEGAPNPAGAATGARSSTWQPISS